MTFSDYLTHIKGYTPSTVANYGRRIKAFVGYLENEGLSPEKLAYPDLIVFINHRQKQGHRKAYLNLQLSAIKHYLDFLVQQQVLPSNVASGLFVRGTLRRLPAGLLTGAERRQLYEQYVVQAADPVGYPRQLRNKVLTGLMVFQGLLPEEMQKLRVSDLQLEQASIQISASKRSQARTLKLEAVQLMPIQAYLRESQVSQALFEGRVSNLMGYLLKDLKGINPAVKHASQLKMSLLTELLGVQDLRQVQAFAGHRFVSSTERYQTTHLQNLQNDLNRFHPLQS